MNVLIKKFARMVSSALQRRPALVFRVQEWWLRVGYDVLDLRMAAWVIRRPEWLQVKSGKVPMELEPELPVGRPDQVMAERIVSQFRAMSGSEGAAGALIPSHSMWGVLRQEHYAELRTQVERGNAPELGLYLAKLFRTSTVNGYSYGSTFKTSPHRWSYLPVAIELSIVTFAEALGVLRAETHEQGVVAYWRQEFTEEQLMQQLEKRVGFRIEAPRHGDPRGIMFGGRFVVRETFSHLYTAWRVREILDRQGLVQPLNFVEIGGGYGGVCYWLRRVLGARIHRYVIVDLPEVGTVQAYFLGSCDPSSVQLFGEPVSDLPGKVELLPHFKLSELRIEADVLFNQDSMPEMPQSEVERYLEWGTKSVRGLFISFNQEAYSPWKGELQVHVPSVASRHPQYKRISRETSWDRRGYVEEVYQLNQ